MNRILIEESKVPYKFKYPESIRVIIEKKQLEYALWYFMDEEQALMRIEGLKNRYPTRLLIPFAKRDDCEDIACFEVGKGYSVQIIRDFLPEGFEQKKTYSDIGEWLEDANREMQKIKAKQKKSIFKRLKKDSTDETDQIIEEFIEKFKHNRE